MEKPRFTYDRTPHYYEIDGMRIVHHSNYIRWFEEARIQYMENKGYPYSKFEENGIMIPVLGVDCQYKSPVSYGQMVTVHAIIEEFDGVRLKVSYEIRDKETGKLHITGSSSHCFVRSDTFRPVRLQKEHPDMAEIFM